MSGPGGGADSWRIHTRRTVFQPMALKPGAQRVGHRDVVEVEAAVLQSGQRLVGEGDEGLEAHPRVLLDAHEVVVVVRRVARGAHDRAVRPGLDHVADGGVRAVAPRPCAGLDVAVDVGSAHAGRDFTR